MKRILRPLSVCLVILPIMLQAQVNSCTDCNCLLKKAQRLSNAGDFELAINVYAAARGHCPDSSSVEIDEGLIQVFKTIDGLRVSAQKARKEALMSRDSLSHLLAELEDKNRELINSNWKQEQRRVEAEAAKEEIQKQVAKNEAIIKAFYFFEGSLALAFDGSKFGYVNKNGEAIIPYQFTHAEQFERLGYARVVIDDTLFIIDRHGQRTKTENSEVFESPKIGLDLKWTVDFSNTKLQKRWKASDRNARTVVEIVNGSLFSGVFSKLIKSNPVYVLDLANIQLSYLNKRIYYFSGLKVLLLGGNKLSLLNSRIGEFKSLSILDLSNNRISMLPKGFRNLQALEALDLSGNYLNEFPPEILSLKALKSLYLGGNQCVKSKEQRILLENQMQENLPNCKVYFD